MSKIQVPAILTSFSSSRDGGASIRFSTNEINDVDFLELKRNQGEFGWVLFSPNEFTLKDLPKEQAEDKQKTPSKRLRAVLFVLAQQEGIPSEKFEEYYRMKIEKIIEFIKAKLDK